MALVFPSDDASAQFAYNGAGKLYIGAYVASGADATLTDGFVGATTGGVEFDPKRTVHPIEVDQYLGAIGAFPTKEDYQVKFTSVDTTLANFKRILALSTSTLTGGTRASTTGALNLGEENARAYYQIVWSGAALTSNTGSTARILQLYRCVFMSVGAVKFEKGKETTVQVTFTALSDPSAVAAGKPAVGIFTDI